MHEQMIKWYGETYPKFLREYAEAVFNFIESIKPTRKDAPQIKLYTYLLNGRFA